MFKTLLSIVVFVVCVASGGIPEWVIYLFAAAVAITLIGVVFSLLFVLGCNGNEFLRSCTEIVIVPAALTCKFLLPFFAALAVALKFVQ